MDSSTRLRSRKADAWAKSEAALGCTRGARERLGLSSISSGRKNEGNSAKATAGLDGAGFRAAGRAVVACDRTGAGTAPCLCHNDALATLPTANNIPAVARTQRRRAGKKNSEDQRLRPK
jgi:hypothetical protein